MVELLIALQGAQISNSVSVMTGGGDFDMKSRQYLVKLF